MRSAAVDWRLIAKVVCLFVLPFICYWPALNGSFLWDDAVLITDNELLKSLGGLRDIWFSTEPYDFFPLTYTSFWLEWRCWGSDPAGYHLVNLALHLASAFLLWKTLRELRLPGAWLGALFFAVHPLNVASVAWIAERKNALSMTFYLACLLSYARSENSIVSRTRTRWYVLAVGFFLLAALSKSSVVMLPFVLLLLTWWQRGKIGWLDLARSTPFFVISLGCGLVTMWFQYHRAMSPEFHEVDKLPIVDRLLMSGRCNWFYLSKALLPVRLSMLYPRWRIGSSATGDYLPLLCWIALLAILWLGRRRWGRGPLAALFYFTVTLLPVSGLFHTSFFTYSYVSDHFVHLSLVGIVVGVSTTLGRWYESHSSGARLAAPTAALLTLSLSLACVCRADQFSSPAKLWQSTRKMVPDSFAVYNNLGADALKHGHLAEAEADFRYAFRLEPRSFSAINSLASVLRIQGKWQQAAACYETILRIEPKADCYNNLGVVFLEMGDPERARPQFYNALAMVPCMGNAYFNLYKTELSERHLSAAAAALRGCLRCNPDDAEAMIALVSLGFDASEAGPESPAAFPVTPGEAITLAERACQLTGYRNPQALAVRGRALLNAGR